jgi:hypothetical protein
MNDASAPRSASQTTCPACGAVQPSARRCRDCGTALPWSRPVLKGRDRALAAAVDGGRGSRWKMWVAGSAFLLLAGALAAVHWRDSAPTGPSVAALEAEAVRDDPHLQRFLSEDPDAASQVRAALAVALELRLSRQEALIKVQTLLRELQAMRDPTVAAQADSTPGSDPNSAEDRGDQARPAAELSDSASLGQVGVPRPQARRCFGTGADRECIETFDDPGAQSAQTDNSPAAVLKRVETLRRKAAESAKILEKL